MKMLYTLMFSNLLKKTGSLLLCMCFLAYCTNKETKEYTQLTKLFEALQKEMPNENTKACIIIIPNVGCTGCIGEAEKFMLNNINSLKNMQFVLTDINSKKAFKVRFKDVLHHSCVIIDYENLAETQKLRTIYPKIFYIQERKITKIVEASPEYKGNAWKELRDYLNAQK